MPSPRPNRKKRLAEWIAQRNPQVVDLATWRELHKLLEPVSDRALRGLLREAGIPIEAPYGGVRQHSFEELAESLVELEQAYREALARNDADRAHLCRRVVIEAKDHARLASRNPRVAEEKRTQKSEMVDWMLVWLENPEIFPLWAKLRLSAR